MNKDDYIFHYGDGLTFYDRLLGNLNDDERALIEARFKSDDPAVVCIDIDAKLKLAVSSIEKAKVLAVRLPPADARMGEEGLDKILEEIGRMRKHIRQAIDEMKVERKST